MFDFLFNIAQFALQASIILACILISLAFVASIVSKNKDTSEISVKSLNKKLIKHRHSLQKILLNKKAFKALLKEEKAKEKTTDTKKNIFVLDFNGDIKASATDQLRQEISALLMVAKPGDEVVVKLESPGGMVHGYGLAASQLKRITDQGITLTACVDKIAASGGYMMASIANKIVSAPFAIIGSIGVVASMPNFNKVLKKVEVEYLEITAGEYKRTLTPLGEITEPGMKKFKEQIEEVHDLFKNHVTTHRPQTDISKVATGEYWYGSQAKDLNLVDEIGTSDDYLLSKLDEFNIMEVSFKAKKGLKEKLSESLKLHIETIVQRAYESIWNSRYN